MGGEQEGPPQDEVDLIGADVGVVGDGERDEVDVLPGQLQLRALVALLDVLGDQGMEPQLGRDGGRERGRWVDQVHPVTRRRLPDHVAQRVQPGKCPRTIAAEVLDPEPGGGLRGQSVRRQ